MTLVLALALRTSLPLLVALLTCACLPRRSAALRHRILATGSVASVLVLLLSVLLPAWHLPLLDTATVSIAPANGNGSAAGTVAAVAPDLSVPSTATQAGIWIGRVAFAAWLTGVASGLAALLVSMVRLRRLTKRADDVVGGAWGRIATEVAAAYGIRQPLVLRATHQPGVLATWGFFTPYVLIPAHARAWPDAWVDAALRHELAHVERGDWLMQRGAELLRMVFWFDPLCWMLCTRMAREAERASDDVVLGSGVPASAYALCLVDIAKACRPTAPGWLPTTPIARPSTLEGRITAMLNPQIDRRVPTATMKATMWAVVLCAVLPAASFTLSAQVTAPRALTGHVYDATGRVLPAGEVTLIDDRQARWSAVTDGQGAFQFAAIAPGSYVIEVELPGFRMLRNDFVLAGATDWNRNVTMQVGELEETIRVTAKRLPQPARAAAAGIAPPVRVGGNIKAPQKLVDRRPIYPAEMRSAGLEGLVPMDALIGRDGRVVSVRTVSAQIHPEFARAAEDAVRQWMFSPTLLNDEPVEVQMTVSVTFSLED